MRGLYRLRKRRFNNNQVFRVVIIVLIFLSLWILLRIVFLYQKPDLKSAPNPATLEEIRTAIVVSPVPTDTPSPRPSFFPSPEVSPRPSPNKTSYIIAAFGDSMVDTMGENLDYLDKALMARYPTTQFKFYNYGIGSQNVNDALKRFGDPLIYKDRNYPPITEINADIIIISSFAYNPLEPYNKNAYLASLKEVINKSKSTGAKIYLFAEIAPIRTGFGKGIGGVNWDEEKVKIHTGLIFSNLDGMVNLASQTKTPLINAYKKSQTDGKYGDKRYVGTHDGIHPSIEGEIFMADLIAETISLP